MHSLLLPTISSGFAATSDRRCNHQTGQYASRSDSDESSSQLASSSSSQLVDRRSAIEQSGIALSSLLMSQTLGVGDALALGDYDDSKKKRILITGANSGIGLDAAQRMALRGHEVILACRTLEKAKGAAEKIKDSLASDADDAVSANELIKSLRLGKSPRLCVFASSSALTRIIANMKSPWSVTWPTCRRWAPS